MNFFPMLRQARFLLCHAALGMGAILTARGAALPSAAAREVDFVKDIQPILSERCYSCHGAKKQEGQLRWDAREIALRGGEHGPVIVPGKSDQSKMILLVAGVDPENVMPKKGERLSTEQVGLLRRWIDQGANWPENASVKIADPREHWSFKAPVLPRVPAVKNAKWPRNELDRFVLARLEKENLKPSPEADRATLLRRLSLDLTGLPPTIAELDAFLADRSPEAYGKQVERLLASPHYGERWGRHWLDAARYADSNGFEKDLARSIWPYRDWVINALNRDLPFDQFAIEQLAGDLLPNATLEQKVATGFLRNSMLNEEGGVDPEQFRVESVIDRVDCVGKTFLGLTVNCAQCHNHKYDPISQKEYYQLFAFLNSDDEPDLEVPSAQQSAERAAILKKVAAMEDALLHGDAGVRARMAEWEKTMRELPRRWTVLEPESFFAAVGTKLTKLGDNSLLATASSPPNSGYTVTARTRLKNITAFRIETLRDANLPSFGPGRSKNGNFVLTEFSVDAAPMEGGGPTNRIALQHATADLAQTDFPVTSAIDGVSTNKTGWGIDAGPLLRNRDHQAVFETKEGAGYEGGTIFTFSLQQSFGQQHTIGRFRIAVSTDDGPVMADPLTPQARAILAVAPEKRSPEQQRILFEVFRMTDPQLAGTNKKIDELMKTWPEAATTLVLMSRAEPRETHIFKRGNFQKPGDAVAPGVPAVLHALPANAPLNRLTFARWIADRKNPMTPRVMVNRFWQEYFGRGLVMTAEDLGTQGEAPSHPELLDWLACTFMDGGWSMKAMHRLIVNSATYRQSSRVSPELYQRDQYNRLLAHGPRFRLEGEIVRDVALSAAGLLSGKVGGPPVYPPIPPGVLNLGYDVMKWPTSAGEERYRRAMYTFWKRSVPYPALSIFDVPNADVACPRRLRSNTPLQALTTLNDTLFQEAAQAMALRIYREGGTNEVERARFAFRLCTSRAPSATELQTVLGLYTEQINYFDGRTASALKVALADPKTVPEDLNLHSVAAWTMVSRVLLNLDEALTKE